MTTDSDMPRERLVALGAGALSDAELVAIHLGTGRRGEHVLTLARALLAAWGGLSGMSRASVQELARTPGVGPAKASRLVAAFGLADRATRPARLAVRGSADVAAVAMPRIGRARVEEVLVVVLDGAHRVSHVAVVSRAGASGAPVPIRETLTLVLRYDGVAFAVAHNHPGGDPTPSAADVAATERLRAAAAEVGLRFLDHVVVTANGWRSVTAAR